MKSNSSLFLFVILLASLNYAGSDIVGETPAVNTVSATFISSSFSMVEFDNGNTVGLYDSILYFFNLNVTQIRELNVDILFYDAQGIHMDSYNMQLGNEIIGNSTYLANIPAEFLFQFYYNGNMTIDFFIREYDSANNTSTTIGSVSRTLLFNYLNYERPSVYIDYSSVFITPYDDDLGVYNPTVAGSADGIMVQIKVIQSVTGTANLYAFFYNNITNSNYESIGDSANFVQIPGTYIHELFIPVNNLSQLNGTFAASLQIRGDFEDSYGNFTYIPYGPLIPFQMNSTLFETSSFDISLVKVFEIDNNGNGLTNEIVLTFMVNATVTRLYYLDFIGVLDGYSVKSQVQNTTNKSVVIGPSYTYVNVTFITYELYNQSLYSNTFELNLFYSFEMIHYTYSIIEYISVGSFNVTNLNFDVAPVWISSIELIGMYNPALGLNAGFDYMEVRLNFTSSITTTIDMTVYFYDMYWFNLYGFSVNEYYTPGNYSMSYYIDGATVSSFNVSSSLTIHAVPYYNYNGDYISIVQVFNNYVDSSSYNPSGQYGSVTSSTPTTPPSNTTSPTTPTTTTSTTPTSTLGNLTSSVTNSSGTLGNTTNNAPPTPELPLPVPSFWLTISSFAIMMVVLRRRRQTS